MLGTGRGPQRQALVQQRVKPAADALIARAKEQGALRGDMQPWDFPMIQLMIAGVTDHTGHPDLWRRYLHLILDGMRAQPGAATPLPVGEFHASAMMTAIDNSASDTTHAQD
jgi:hypothetical protein